MRYLALILLLWKMGVKELIMKLGIIGQGAASLFLSLALAKDNNIDITIIDKNEKLFKKLYATGNGRCNLGNFMLECQTFNNEFAFDLSKKYDANSLITFLNEFGVLTRTFDESLIYPYSLSAKSLIDFLISYLKKRNVNFINNTEVVEYKLEKNNRIKVISKDNNEFVFDKLIIDTGGKSSLNLGTDGSFFEILKKHGYEISSFYPGLTPIKVKENIKELENERIKVVATLKNGDKELYKESGEVIFKKDALSGIVMMNFSSIIARNFNSIDSVLIKLDLFKDYSSDDLYKLFKKDNNDKVPFLYGYFSKKVADYIYKESNIFNKNKILGDFELKLIVSNLKELTFTFKELYPFSSSQVTIGGVLLSEINKTNFESKREKNVYLIGEVLNLDGLCGGHNISLCYAEAMELAKALKKNYKE